jgi:hypothetical protein
MLKITQGLNLIRVQSKNQNKISNHSKAVLVAMDNQELILVLVRVVPARVLLNVRNVHKRILQQQVEIVLPVQADLQVQARADLATQVLVAAALAQAVAAQVQVDLPEQVEAVVARPDLVEAAVEPTDKLLTRKTNYYCKKLLMT